MKFFTVLNTIKAGKTKKFKYKVSKIKHLSGLCYLLKITYQSLKPINYFKFFDK